ACLDYADRTLEIARAIDDKAIEATIIGVIAGVKSYQDQDYEASMLLVKQSLDIARQNNLPHTAKRAIINIAYTLNNLGRYDEAVEFLTDN
ncbi:MAG: hypothetical protein AAFO91_06125, partial [Bacteroidota bacterium]